MTSLEERFEAKVDRSGEHHIWTGAKKQDGSGVLKIGAKPVTAQRVAWELAHGDLPTGAQVKGCPDDKACVRVDHLTLLETDTHTPQRARRARGSGSIREIRAGVWEVAVTRGVWDDGTPRRLFERIEAQDRTTANAAARDFIARLDEEDLPDRRSDWEITVDEGVERYLMHLAEDKGRARRTVDGYQGIYDRWFKPELGGLRLREVGTPTFDDIFGEMRRAGLSWSRMNEARSLFAGLYRWAKHRRMLLRLPITKHYELPRSKKTPKKRRPPELDQLCAYLAAAVRHIPDIAPVLTLGATTGLRPEELLALRRSNLDVENRWLFFEEATDKDASLKSTKTGEGRWVALDDATVEMLERLCDLKDERARNEAVELVDDPFLFSTHLDCGRPMRPDYVSKQVGTLKEHLGIANKSPEVIALEDEALELFESKPVERPAGRRGPKPKGAMTYTEIGKRLGRSQKWASLAVASAKRRQIAGIRTGFDYFDGSIVAMRKFTSTELLDAGFNIAAIADRQGHSPEVLLRHYAGRRLSADRKAAEHLGRLIHQQADPPGPDPAL